MKVRHIFLLQLIILGVPNLQFTVALNNCEQFLIRRELLQVITVHVVAFTWMTLDKIQFLNNRTFLMFMSYDCNETKENLNELLTF